MKGNLHLQFIHVIDFIEKLSQMGWSEVALVTTQVSFGWKAIHPSRPTTYNSFIWGGFLKNNSLYFNLIEHVLQTYQPHFRA
jgi:hypothetical protein